MLHYFLAAVPPELGGLPGWGLNALSAGSLVSFIVLGLATSRLYTKRQVDELTKQHEREVGTLTTQHNREVTDLKARFESHIDRTVQLYQGRVEDALTREKDWRDVARKWETTCGLLAQGIEPMQEQSETTLRILQAWQSESRRKGSDS